MYRLALFLFALVLAVTTEASWASGPYLGQSPPADGTAVFAPDIVSTADHEFGITFSPDGMEFFFTRMPEGARAQVIMHCASTADGWRNPTVAPFSGQHADMEPCISPDGDRVYFVSFRPVPGAQGFTPDIWVSHKADGEWGEATHLGEPFNPGRSMYLSFTDDGAIYTTDAQNRGGILVTRPNDDGYGAFEKLGAPVHTGREAHPWVAPDESYLIFDSVRESVRGLFVSFRTGDGWSEPVSMGEFTGEGGIAMVTADGRHLFYTAKGDIYWVGAGFLDQLRTSQEG